MTGTILVLGAGLYQARALEKIAAAGFRVIAVDQDPEAPGRSAASEFHAIDLLDARGLLDLARDRRIDGVMPVNDFGTPAAARLAGTLGLVGNSEETAWLCNDKGAMRQCWRNAGLSSPDFRVLESADAIAPACRSVGYPCVVKPALTGGGGRGISVVTREDEIPWATAFATPHARNGRFVVEEFIDGLELTVEAVSVDGRHQLLAMSDKVKPAIRTRVATSLNYTAAISASLASLVERTVFRALDALGHRQGLSHTEVIVDVAAETVTLVETGARPGGGHIFHTLIEAVSGIDAPVLNAQILTGQQPVIPTALRRGGCYRFFNPPSGTLVRVEGWTEALALPGVCDMGLVAKPGQTVGSLRGSHDRPGFVVTRGADRAEAIAAADAVETTVRFVLAGTGHSTASPAMTLS